MGLAPYGNPKFKDLILDNLIDLKKDGSFKLNMEYFNYTTGLTMTNQKFSKLFGHPVRDQKRSIKQFSYGCCIFHSGSYRRDSN